MNIEIITIGREILDGRVLDTNSSFFGQELLKCGLVPSYAQRVDDIKDDMHAAFEIASQRSQYVLVTGGLGPTLDDLTAEVFANFCKQKLIQNKEATEIIKSSFAKMNRPIQESQWKQVWLPEFAEVLDNPHGTAPGFHVYYKNIHWFFMPGVPREMKPMFKNHVLPKIPSNKNFICKMWMTQFTSEGELQQRLSGVIDHLPRELSFFYRTRFPENHLGLSGTINSESLKKDFDDVVQQVDKILGSDVFSDVEGQELEQIVVALAKKNGSRTCAVESCTGGLVSSRLTNVSGSSEVFLGSMVTYSNDMKLALAKQVGRVDEMRVALDTCGAVSQEVANLMAECGSSFYSQVFTHKKQYCVSTTGIAGPTGGTLDKPVGLCYISLACDGVLVQSDEIKARPGLERDQLKLLFSQKALDLLRREFLKNLR